MWSIDCLEIRSEVDRKKIDHKKGANMTALQRFKMAAKLGIPDQV